VILTFSVIPDQEKIQEKIGDSLICPILCLM